MNAREISSAIRKGETTAKDVLENHLTVIQDREEEIHAFNLVMTEEARNEAEGIDALIAKGKDPGPLAGIQIGRAHV